MTDLEAISESPAPRAERLAQRFARRIHPTWGFVLAGVLYWLFVANLVGSLPVTVVISSYAPAEVPVWLTVAALIWYPLVQVPLWWLFRRWIIGRRADSVRLVRDGELVTASVTRTTGIGARHPYTIAVNGIVLRPLIDFGDEQRCKVLFRTGAEYCFVFAPDGSAVAWGITGGNPLGPILRESNVDPLPAARIVE